MTTQEGIRRTQALKRVFDEGFISRDLFEAIKRRIVERVKADSPVVASEADAIAAMCEQPPDGNPRRGPGFDPVRVTDSTS
jgi:hypothetical protein